MIKNYKVLLREENHFLKVKE